MELTDAMVDDLFAALAKADKKTIIEAYKLNSFGALIKYFKRKSSPSK